MITNWPIPLPEIAALAASPRRSGNHRLINTLTGATDDAACPTANTKPYSTYNCQAAFICPIRAIAAAPTTVPIAIMTLMLYVSISRPTIGIVNADTTMKIVKADVRAERLRSRSSLMGLSTNPKAIRVPLLKNSTVNPEARMTWL